MGATSAFLLTVFQIICAPQGCQGSQLQIMVPTDKEELCIREGLGMVSKFIEQNYGKPTHTYTFTCKKIEVPGAPPSPAVPGSPASPDKKDDTI